MGEIGPSVLETIDTFPKGRRLLAPFLDLFDVTWFSRKRGRGSEIHAFMLKPNEQASETFGIQREVLLIHSQYSSIQERTLQLAEDLLETDPVRGRCEPWFFVLVSRAKDLEERAKLWITDKKKALTALTIREDECLNPHDGFVVTRRFRELFQIDHFDDNQPISRDSHFFGRAAEIVEYRNALLSGENIGLFGLRKSGKTSTLLKLQRQVESEKNARFTYLDAQSPDIFQCRWWELIDRIRQQLNPGEVSVQGSEKKSANLFRKTVERIAPKKHIVAIDEVEHISPRLSPQRHWDEDFLYFWKTIRSVQATNRHITFVVCGVNAHPIEAATFSGADNPLYNMCKIRYMPALQLSEVKDMLNRLGPYMGMHFTTEAISYMRMRYGGHPFLTRMACSYTHKHLPNESRRPCSIKESLLLEQQDGRERHLLTSADHILAVLKNWHPDEFDMLTFLADDEIDVFRKLERDNPRNAEHLRNYAIVEDNPPRLSIPLMRMILHTERPELRISENTPRTPSDEQITLENLKQNSAARNRLELKLRRYIKRQLRSHYADKWAQHLLKCMDETRQERVAGISADDILNKHTLFSDLINCIVTNWQAFRHLEEREKRTRIQKASMETLLRYINDWRADCHAQQLSDADLVVVLTAVHTIEHSIDDFLTD